MNVYRIEPFAKPPGNKFQYFAQLDCKERDFSRIEYDDDKNRFNGLAYPKPWRPLTMYFGEAKWPRSDFFYSGRSHFACTERARELVGPAMEKSGEFLPIRIEREEGKFFIFNITNRGDFVDPTRSIWEHDSDEPDDPVKWKAWKQQEIKSGRRLFRILVAPAFNPRKIGKNTLFKIPENWGRDMYCAERTADPAKNEFKALVEHHKLTGLRFAFAWSEKRGPVPKGFPPAKGSGDVWKTGDGKKYKGK